MTFKARDWGFLKCQLEPIPFAEAIKKTTGYDILPVSSDDESFLDLLTETIEEVIRWANTNQVFRGRRVNEVSNALERQLRDTLNDKRIYSVIPQGRLAGYPNIESTWEGRRYYLEVKLTGEEQVASSLRAFYHEAGQLVGKITQSAPHILVSFLHKAGRVTGWKLVDLSKIMVRLKREFNANNPELYRHETIIRES